ncbi:MAG: protein-disulfide reductase DsbD family protein [Myxococcales bacterium]
MKYLKLLGGAAVAALLVAFLPEVLGPGPTADFQVGDQLAGGALLAPLALIFLGGILTALTPCVYPLIPITVSVFGARKAESRAKAVALTFSYVLGIGVMFTGLGIAAALSGKAFGSALGNPWIVSAIAAMLAALAMSMFGAFELALPSSLATRLNMVGGAGYGGAFLMGLVAGIIAAPCTGPVLSGVLLHVATTQNVVQGALLLFTYAMGIGVPFFLIGAFSVSLPRSGAWMEGVKSIFGIALLTLAFGYLRDVFPAVKEAILALRFSSGMVAAAVLVFAGVLVGAVHRSFHWPSEGALKSVGVALVVVGLLLRTGSGGAVAASHLQWLGDEPTAVNEGKAQKKPVLLDFYADWCAACKELDEYVYPHELFVKEGSRFVLAKIDGTSEPPEVEALYQKYGIKGLPTVIFIDSDGKVREDLTITGFMKPEEFVKRMKKIE